MSEELMVCEAGMALAVAKGKNYEVTSPLTGAKVKLERGTDFAVIPGTKQPSITKSGSEKIIMAYGLMPRYEIVSSIEQGGKDAMFFYTVKCALFKGFRNPVTGEYNETEYANGYGSANTNEKRNGMNGPFDAANSTLKMAQKRALSSAALAISGLSSMFTQDMENETFTKKANEVFNEDPEAPVTSAQIKRIFAVAGDNGLTSNECKQKLAAWGFASTKDIKQGQLEDVINKLKSLDEKENT